MVKAFTLLKKVIANLIAEEKGLDQLTNCFLFHFQDNIDTRSVLESLKELVYKSNIYIKENESNERPVVKILV